MAWGAFICRENVFLLNAKMFSSISAQLNLTMGVLGDIKKRVYDDKTIKNNSYSNHKRSCCNRYCSCVKNIV